MALPTIDFAAPLIRKAITTLQERMPGQVAAFNTEPGQAVQLAAPATYHFGGNDLLSAFEWPQVEVAAVDGRFGALSLGHVEADHSLKLNVVVWLEGDKGEFSELYEQSLGLARCVIESLTPLKSFGDEVYVPNGGIYWRADAVPYDLTDDGRDFRRWRTPVLIQFSLELTEAF